MSTSEYIKSVTRQAAFLNKLIREAETIDDGERAELLLGMAREESDNLSKSLRQHLSRVHHGHKLNAA